MSEHQTDLRIFGASAGEVLRVLLDACDPLGIAIDGHGLALRAGGGLVLVDHLSTRGDGVVVVHLHDSDGSVAWPEGWTVYRRTWFSRGVDYDVLSIHRGARDLLEVSRGPDGDLTLTLDGEQRVAIRPTCDEEGMRLPDGLEGVTFRALAEQGLAAVAGLLGADALVLSDGARTKPGVVPTQRPGEPDDDEVPF